MPIALKFNYTNSGRRQYKSFQEVAEKAPEKDIIFEWFGHAGNEDNDYCVSDGAFANQKVKYPKNHYIRRQWNPNDLQLGTT
jgi:hypothetical protein